MNPNSFELTAYPSVRRAAAAKCLSQQNTAQNHCIVVQFVMRRIYESDSTVSSEFADLADLQNMGFEFADVAAAELAPSSGVV